MEDLDELARGSIEQHLIDEVLCKAMEYIPKQTWDELEKMFALKSLSNKIFLKEELHSLKIKEGASVYTDLQRLDEIYKSEDNVVMLLTSMPPSYKHFRMTLMFDKGTLKYEEVMKDILTHHRMVQRFGDSSRGEGLMEKARDRGRLTRHEGKKSNRRRSKSKVKDGCFEYGPKDHWNKNCLTWREKRNKG
ncbi:PREDICTED: Retrovirus-related Pol poly from transposon TNT [Prunus dulcis]|uniref:PREDICTED: Retrovirus-related Pol poly from transposon TNT n=1 Tax=Prunus dulcis TaxID=3755 RepID=A0A5E4F7D4_PRUDU|nr:PREDICTED: Retrovirus-related Pol poly from transposon TNT [Prunus dulcis]